MIVLNEKINKDKKGLESNTKSFEDVMQDGRLTEPSDGKIYRLREAIMLTKVLGRELTKDEMSKFEC